MRVELRAEQGERAGWLEAAEREGYLSASDWIRDRLNAAARASRHGSSVDQTWNTPPDIIRPIVRAFGRVDLDPCSNARSVVRARVAWELVRDGDSLARSWKLPGRGRRLIFVNPPYIDAAVWIAKCCEVWRELGARGVEIVVLVPARTETQWWRAARRAGALPGYYEGRISFLSAESGRRTGALFPSALLYFGKRRALLAGLPRIHL